jgi:hypothetical protein
LHFFILQRVVKVIIKPRLYKALLFLFYLCIMRLTAILMLRL